MSDVILYIAISLDGYIASKDGSVAWLDEFNQGTGADYGYISFYEKIGVVVMGGVTYRQVLGFGEWPYSEKMTYVVTSRGIGDPANPSIQAYAGDVRTLTGQIRQEVDQDIWLVGGANLVAQFLHHDLIVEYILFFMPILLGEGIPLFQDGFDVKRLKLLNLNSYPNGVVRVVYRNLTGDLF